MKNKLFKSVLSFVLAISMIVPSSVMMANAETSTSRAAYEYEEVSVIEPVSNSWHETTGTSGDGPAAWAFDNDSNTHWHSNYTATSGENKVGTELTWTSVSTIPAYAEVASSRAWIGGEFNGAITLGKVEYSGRVNKNANWYGQYALYVANVSNGEAKDTDFQLAASGTNSGNTKVTITLPTPMKATHFRLVAFTATGNNNVSASEIDVFEALVGDTTPVFGGAIADTDKQWTDDTLSQVKRLTKTSETLNGWKNDKVISEIALYAANASYDDVKLSVSEFTDGKGNVLEAEAVFVRSTKAYNGGYLGYGSPDRVIPADNGTNRSESADIIWNADPVDMAANTVQPVWVEVDIPEDAEAGTYTGTVTAAAGSNKLTFNYTVEVVDAVLADVEDYTFNIMQWQYPYSSAEYYDVEPFSAEHLEILKDIMGVYKEVGGKAITTTFTEEAWSGQTYSANAVHYPSMVKWTKNADGSFSYDYSDFDAWVSLCKEMGLGEKIVAYGIAPWHGSFTYWTAGASNYTKEAYSVGNARYRAVWTDFLTDFAAHLEEKGWKDQVYIGIDERGVNAAAFDVAEAAGLKTAADIDNINNHWEIAQRVTDLNVGDTAAYNLSEQFAELKEIRDEKGFTTTLYSCTEHRPGNFSLSAPVESYWTVLNAAMMDADGFNRWAYDAWVADPLNDATHNSFEPGDCFVIYPDEKNAENPETKYSVRLARMAEGIRDVNKLKQIETEMPALSLEVASIYDLINYPLKTSRSYLSTDEIAALTAETKAFKAALNEVTEKYVAIKNGELKGILNVPESTEIAFGDTYQLEPMVVSDKADKTLTYTSEDEKIATVDENGLITATGRGTTTIVVKNAASGFEAEVEVTVSVETTIINKLRKFVLPEKYQSNVEGAASNEEGTLVGTDRQYLGQPDMVRTETGRLITVFPTGHGHGPLIMKISEDNGETWVEKTDIPSSWAASQETPTLYSIQVDDGNGGTFERLVLVCACPQWDLNLGGWQMSYSDDNGDTWTEFEDFWQTVDGTNKHWTIVAMASLIQLKDEDGNWKQEWMGVYHDYNYVNYKTILTFDEDGNPQWSKPETYLSEYRAIESSHQICEVGMFRSPDGNRIVALARNQTHAGPATMFYSDDEGKTWTEPVELPGSLAGERHKALYDPVTGKLVITFREIDYDRNNNGVWEGGSDWIAGEWVAWVGSYEDLMNLQQGDYMLVLDEDFANNYYSGDTGYTGMAVLEDGTFVLHSYGHWDQAFSSSYVDGGSYNVRTDLCWIRQAKFNLAELEAELEVDKEPEVPADPTDASNDIPVENMTAISESQYLPGTTSEGPDDYILDGNTSTHWHTNWSTSEAESVEKRWVGVRFNEPTEVAGVRLLPRQGNSANGNVTEYKIQYRTEENGEWIELATGTWTFSDTSWKLVTFDEVVAKEIRIVGVHTYADSGNDAHMSMSEFRAVKAKEEPEVIKDELANAIEEASAYTEADYTAESWAVFAEALAEAEEVFADEDATQEDVDAAVEALTAAANALVEAEEEKQEVCEVFTDVAHGKWYEDGIQYVFDHNLMSGNDGLFKPSENITRAQIVTTLYRLAGSPTVTDKSALDEFSDVSEGKYYADAVCWAYTEGVTTGTDGKFNPTGNLTRQQMATFFFRYAEVFGMETETRGDVSTMKNADQVSSYAKDAVLWAVGTGLISGSEVTDASGNLVKDLNPKGNTTRAQVATILMRFCENNEI